MDLSGVAAHDPASVTDGKREAAVLAGVLRPADPRILFMKRADSLGEHAGQMSFPGGGREPEDEGLLGTALREAHEEVGIDPSEAEVVGRLDDIRTVTRYSVRPFVARISDRRYDPDGREAVEAVALPVADLTDPANYESERRDHPHYGEIRLHFFHVDGYTVWGATGRMLAQLLALTTDWRPSRALDREIDADADLPI